MTTLNTPSVILRPWEERDVASLATNANDRRVWENLRDRFPHPYGHAEASSWVAFATAQPAPVSLFAVTLRDEAIGAIGLERFDDVHRGTAEIGYWLGVAHWGRGYATDAATALTAYGFETLGLERIQAGVYDWNPASARVLVKAGYTFEGRMRRHVMKDGKLGDVLLYAAVREDRREPDERALRE
jgi:[ribosomal protein S5]-alanine N-acetyltransferase